MRRILNSEDILKADRIYINLGTAGIGSLFEVARAMKAGIPVETTGAPNEAGRAVLALLGRKA